MRQGFSKKEVAVFLFNNNEIFFLFRNDNFSRPYNFFCLVRLKLINFNLFFKKLKKIFNYIINIIKSAFNNEIRDISIDNKQRLNICT